MFYPLLQTIATAELLEFTEPTLLIELVNLIRPAHLAINRHSIAEQRIQQLIGILRSEPYLAEGLRHYIDHFLDNSYHLSLYAESGIQSQHGLFSEALQKLTYAVLPPAHSAETLRGVVNLVFHDSKDYEWLQSVSEHVLVELLQVLGWSSLQGTLSYNSGTYSKILSALLVLSHKLAAMGTEGDVITRLPKLSSNRKVSIAVNSFPFLQQHREIVQYVESIQQSGLYPIEGMSTHAQYALRMLVQCEEAVESIRRNRAVYGTSLSLTYQLERIMQHTARLRALIHLTLQPANPASDVFTRRLVYFWREVVEAENTHHNLRKHFAQNTALLAFQIVENAAKTGEHYITTTRKEFKEFFRSSMGGGLVVAFLVCIKIWIAMGKLPPFGEALLFSLNYGLGFIIIHLFGFKLATKQPAMTASAIAESLDVRRQSALRGEISLPNLVKTIACISRSQFISFVGNVLVAFPIGCILAWLFYTIVGSTIVSNAKAHAMVAELHPMLSLSLIYAGIAGVFLFLSGLISGYYDNSVVFNNIPERIRRHPALRRILQKRHIEGLAVYIENNLGALAGNFFLGCMLGITFDIGVIVGLPLDIRHITFAAGSFAVGLTSLLINGQAVGIEGIIWTTLGIVGIGAMNFIVSFSLALFVAIRSRNINIDQSAELLRLLAQYFRTNTREFFFPPPDMERLERLH
ncbi:MAG: site-specific recombinase [Bacteroidota bacterium]|nr:site-specific recombinase [Candidatus Kapabacteria bacterium]MDW8220788.1 site-specific recombinase [Bacteroidota bacterium]